MNMPWGSEESAKFITNVGLITSNGPNGHNIQAAEWTHHVSYSPGIIAVSIGKDRTTRENIIVSKEFGVSLAATDQNVISGIAGGSHGKDVDKIGALKELGYKFYNAKKIKALLVDGAAFHAECKVIGVVEVGDHTLFIGEVLDVKISQREPIIYHGNKYFRLGEMVEKPSALELERMKSAVEKFRKSG